jgi:phenylpyruvate tautomerase PptA (4-oxalocrotonate tautomerase family)
MPIVDVEIVGLLADTTHAGLAQRVADAIGAALNSRPQGTWVKLRFLDDSAYAENDAGRPDGAQPVFVTVLLAELPGSDVLSQHALQIATAVADACGRSSENVHIVFESAASRRVAFGGLLQG